MIDNGLNHPNKLQIMIRLSLGGSSVQTQTKRICKKTAAIWKLANGTIRRMPAAIIRRRNSAAVVCGVVVRAVAASVVVENSAEVVVVVAVDSVAVIFFVDRNFAYLGIIS